jgi:hypothetical protein
MKRILLIALLFYAVAIGGQEIKVSYSMIDELYQDENFSMIVKISGGYFTVKEIYLVTSSLQGTDEKRFKMEVENKTASISVPFTMVPKQDFYYYFEIVRKDNEILYFPKLPLERVKNKVIHKKEEKYKPVASVLLSPLSDVNLTPEDFLFAVYIDGKAGELKLIVDGEDVTDKCIAGEKILTYNPGRIFQPRKYRFDVIHNGILLQTYYFNFASSGFIKSLFKGALYSLCSYDKFEDSAFLGDARLHLFGGVSSFYYDADISAGNMLEGGKNYIERYSISLGLNRQRINAGMISLCRKNAFLMENSITGVSFSSNAGSFGFNFAYGFLNDRIINNLSPYEKEAGLLSILFNSEYYYSEISLCRFSDYGDSLTNLNPNDDVLMSHRQTLKLLSEKIIFDYEGGMISSKHHLFEKNFNVFSGMDSIFSSELLSTYSQIFKGSLFLRNFNMNIELSDMTDNFRGFYLNNSYSGKNGILVNAEAPVLSERLVFGTALSFSFLKTDSSFLEEMNSRNLDFFISFREEKMPCISLTYIDRLWGNNIDDTVDFNQRLYGFQSNISGEIFILNIKTKASLLLEQLNYKLTSNDSNNYSVGGVNLEIISNIISDLNLSLRVNSHLTRSLDNSLKSDQYGIKLDYANLFSFITPEVSGAFQFDTDSSSTELKRICLSGGVKILFGEFQWVTSLSDNVLYLPDSFNSNYMSLKSNLRYDF